MQYLGQLLRKSKAPRETQENVTPRKQAKWNVMEKTRKQNSTVGKKSMEEFLKALLQEEDSIRELRKCVPIKIGQNDWEDCTSPFSGDVEIKDSILECIPKKTEKYISFSLGGPPVYRQLERFAIMVGFPCEKSPKGNVRTHQRISRKKKNSLTCFTRRGSIRTSTWIAGKGWRNRTAFRSAR